MSDPTMNALVEVGLTSREARAYLTLLRVAPATAAEIADAAGLARPKVYDALKSLEQRGFCFTRGERVARFHAVDPDLALHELARRRDHERRALTERDNRLVSELVSTLPRPHGSDGKIDERYMTAKVGSDGTLRMIVDTVARATRRLDIVVTTPVIQAREDWNVSEVRALERGVSVRILYAEDLIDDPARYLPAVRAGAEVRASSNLPVKVIVRDDGAEAVVSLVDTSNGEFVATSFSVGLPELAMPFQLLFNRQWRQANAFADGQLERVGEGRRSDTD
jgi:sugar-specific transcriptional regulator TrmB